MIAAYLLVNLSLDTLKQMKKTLAGPFYVEDCINWVQLYMSQGNHCWNCAMRCGYPQRAQPDKHCERFKLRTTTSDK